MAAAAYIAAFPVLLLAIFTSSYAVAMGCLFFGFAILTCAYGPIYALVQNVMRPDMRAFAISLTLLATNLIGAGLGPLLIGFASDVAAAEGASNPLRIGVLVRSEEHTSELQSLMRISYAVFCLKKKK